MILKPFKVHSPDGKSFYEGDAPTPLADAAAIAERDEREQFEAAKREYGYDMDTDVVQIAFYEGWQARAALATTAPDKTDGEVDLSDEWDDAQQCRDGAEMKPFAVEVSFTMIVMAEDEDDAYEAALSDADDAWGDSYDKDYTVLQAINTEDDLKRHGWSGDDTPYGTDGHESLRTILAELPPVVERDTRTIDMFQEQAS